MKKRLLLLAIFFLTSTFLTFSQTQMLWSKPQQEYDSNNFNQNQYDCPIWVDYSKLFDLNEIKLSNDYAGVHAAIVRDFDNDGYCDAFFSFYSTEHEKIPFILFLYNPISGKFEDKSTLIVNNIGQTFNRKSVSADFNGDGILDIISVSHPEFDYSELSHLDIILSTPTGWEQKTLNAPNVKLGEGYYHGVSVGDVDNDGDIDFVVAQMHNDDGTITYLNNGSGEFDEIFSIVSSNPQVSNLSETLELFDINDDGCLDLIYHTNAHVPIRGNRIAYGKCDGTFGEIAQVLDYDYDGDREYFHDYDFVDFDTDGDFDLITIDSDDLKTRLVFLENNGIDEQGKVIYTDISSTINEDLESQNFYLDEASKNWFPYIQIIDLNNDGLNDIIKPFPFEGDSKIGLYNQTWVLFGRENLKFDYFNYPITSEVENISEGNSILEAQLVYETTLLPNNPNPFNHLEYPWSLDNLRGNINEWVVYYRQSPFGDKSLDDVKRATISDEAITKELVENNTFKYTFNFQPEFEGSDDIYARITYVDENGIENVLSEQIQFSVSEFDYDGDGVPNISDDCPDTPTGVSVNGNGCSEEQLSDDDGDSVPNYLDECPNTPNGEISDEKGCSESQKDDDEDGIMNDVDNCPQISNENQEDLDDDGEGDACDDDWDGDGVLNSEDNCPEISNSNQSDLDNDGIGDVCDDDIDGDGVLNDVDTCPETPSGVNVDANGCILFESDNFIIETIGETCPDKNNGQIKIEADASYDYTATVNGETHSFTSSSNLTIDGLSPGDYEVCIVVTNQTSPYCYSLTIEEGTTVSGKSSNTKSKTTVDILEGTAPYQVYVNGTSILRTMSSTFDIGTKHGDLVEVKTDVACEGVYSKTVQLFDIMTLYPNPTEGLFELAIPLNLNEVEIELYNYNSQLISKNTYPFSYGKVQLDLTNKSAGMYYVKVLSDTPVMLKIIKK